MSRHTVMSYEPCKVPLRRISAFGVPLTVHEGIVADVLEADRRWREAGGPAFYQLRQRDTGSYNCRNSVGHSRAVAIDFNWSDNPMTSKRTPCPSDGTIDDFYRLCFEPLGYGWGGNWRSKCDTMHISKVASEGGDGVLYRTYDAPPGEQREPRPEPAPDTYTVRRGDSLSSIAARFATTWQELAAINEIPGPDYVIYVGQVLRLRRDGWEERVRMKRTLRNGSTGHDVRLLQSLLVAHGNRPGGWYGKPTEGPDGVFGPGVQSTLKAWQARTGRLPADGVCDADDWAWLVGI